MLNKFAIAASALLITGGMAVAQTGGDKDKDGPTAGSCAASPTHPMCDEAKKMDLTDTKWDGTVAVGTMLPDTVVLMPMTTDTVSVAYINGQRVLVDSKTRAVIEIVP